MRAFFIVLPAVATALSNEVDRRAFVGVSSGAALWILSPLPVIAVPNIKERLDQDILNLPAPSYSSELNGVDNTYFPQYLQGNWEVTQSLVETLTPLGLKYLGGPNGDISIAEKIMEQSRSQIGKQVKLELRYVPTKWGVAEDRLFNTKERLNSFAEKSVVASVQYADVGGSNRKSVLQLGGKEEDPLQTTIVYFKGPAAQKSFVVSHGSESKSETEWIGYELQRSIFALTNQNTAPPVTTDTEYIWKFDLLDDTHVRGKLRIAGYLNAQSDKLFFEARNRAVSIQDYTLDMKKI
eukprot:scaffold2816_cov121-Cylindrotheca_fusiformis.AAC.15